MRRPLVLLALAACNQPPEGLQVALEPAEPGTLDDLVVAVQGEAVDPDGDPVELRYLWRVDDAEVELDGDRVPAARTRRGEVWSVTVTPFDGADVGTAATAEVTIANTVPTATVTITPSSPDEGEALLAEVAYDDPDGDLVEVDIAWTRDGQPAGERLRIPADRTARGEVWEVTVTPRDDALAGEPVIASVTIANTPPTITSATITPDTLDRRTTAECLGSGWFDADGDPEGYRVAWFVDGEAAGTEASLDLAPYSRGSMVRCALTPFDGQDEGETVDTRPVTIANTLPALAEVVIGPDDPRTGTDIEATLGDIDDPDGDDVTLSWTWRIDGDPRGSGTTLLGNRYLGGSSIVLEIVPSDPFGRGETAVSNTLVAANTPPEVTSVVLSPASPDTEEEVVATVTADDADGDAFTLTYAWSVDGSTVTATGDTLSGVDWFDKHDSISVTVTAADDDAGAPVTSETIYAINTPPPAPTLVFDPEEPAADDDVVCVVDTQDDDLDDDSITYTFAWTRDGTTFTGATTTTHTGDTIAAEDRSEGEEWACTVTPHDGDDNGDDATRILGVDPPTGLDPDGTVSKTAFRRGSMTGSTWTEACPTGQVLVGISGDLTSSSGYFAELATRCAPLTVSSCGSSSCTVGTGTITTGTYRGGSGSYVQTEDCPAGSVVTGFTGRSGWYLDQITLRCTPVSVSFDGADWSVSLGTGKDITAVGGTGGGAFSRTDCSTGEVASQGIIGASSGQVDGFQLGCQELAPTYD